MPVFGEASRATQANGTGTENCYAHRCSLARELKVDPAEMRANRTAWPGVVRRAAAASGQYL
jgi:hypothetical protein